MTQIRRQVKQQRVTLFRVALAVISTLIVITWMLQVDDFGKRPYHSSAVVSPDKMLAQEFIRKGSASLILEDQRADVPIVKESAISGSRKFRMQLAGLKNGATGSVLFETRPDWAPLGVEHFHKLLDEHFYDQCRFFRVLPNFVVQFGIAADPQVQKKWRDVGSIKDDPVATTNARGTITFATSGKDTRTTQLFINKKDNKYLDKEGFAPIALVLEGMEVVDEIEDKYKEKPGQGKIVNQGNEYLQQEFPDLSYIVSIQEVSDPIAVE